MLKNCYIFLCFFIVCISYAQNPKNDSTTVVKDSIKKSEFVKQLGNGYLPTKYINIDLRYLLKFNQYEGLRTGLGGTTNTYFSEKLRLNTYVVYGFRDHRFKYSFGAGIKVSNKKNTWINLSYTDDLQETGSTSFLTDKRFFQFFEPRLFNIDLFHKHITKTVSLEHEFSSNLLTEIQFAVSNISPTYNYQYAINESIMNQFHLSTLKLGMQWNPFNPKKREGNKLENVNSGYPRFTLQYTNNLHEVLKSNLSFSKIDFRTIHKIFNKNSSISEITLNSGLALGNAPITHLYHANPNNIRKETIMQRFSVAGLNSFETMYFNEFFSDRFATIQLKHYLKPFDISQRFKPQLVLITRYAIGNMNNIERHQNITFNTLNSGYTESGFEINRLLIGFGLSFTYRHGAYYLPKTEDNIALKFTFNITL